MPRIRLEKQGAIGRIILSRPERKNVMDREMASELFSACTRYEQDGQVRVVHLTADGDDFCVGADLQALSTALGAAGEANREDAEAYGRVLLGIRALMKPVVCSVHGRALGAGTGLATACDLVLAHQDAEFGYPEVRWGAVPALVMTLLRRTVGEKHAADLVLTGRIIAADEAEWIEGLVDSKQFEADQLDVAHLRARPRALQRRTIQRWLQFQGIADLDFDLIERVRALIEPDAPTAKTNLPRGRHVRRRARKLFIE